MEKLIIWQLILLFFTLIHIFEEFGMRVEATIAKYTKAKNARGVYLRICSAIVFICFLSVLLTYTNHRAGLYLSFFPILLALVNFIVHNFAYIKIRKLYGTLAVGVFTTYPTIIAAAITLYNLVPNLG